MQTKQKTVQKLINTYPLFQSLLNDDNKRKDQKAKCVIYNSLQTSSFIRLENQS